MRKVGYDTPVYKVHWFDSQSNYISREFYTEKDALNCYEQIYADDVMLLGMDKVCKAIFSES